MSELVTVICFFIDVHVQPSDFAYNSNFNELNTVIILPRDLIYDKL